MHCLHRRQLVQDGVVPDLDPGMSRVRVAVSRVSREHVFSVLVPKDISTKLAAPN